jgi:eukaryotic-like serine/threonine-protein kinase
MVSIGDTLQGRYRILRLIGEGAMGAVYEGEHLLIHRRVAIKVLHAYARTAEASARFEREAQASGQIESDHITEVLDLGRLDDGDHFIVMEFLTGETLGARLQRLGRHQPDVLVPLVRQVLVGLSAAHAAGIVHRDIKPENLFVLPHKAGQRDFVKILDFGVSKFREKDERGSLALTSAGSMMGTPCYMSPEQARGQGDAGVLTDLYAVGVVLYEGLTGDVPFDGNNLNELLFKIVEGRFVPPRQKVPQLDARLDALVCKALAYAPEQRFQSADAFIDALDAWAKPGTRAARVSLPARASERGDDAGVASTSPLEHSITLPRLRAGARGRGGWAVVLGLLMCAASVLFYRSRPPPGTAPAGVASGAGAAGPATPTHDVVGPALAKPHRLGAVAEGAAGSGSAERGASAETATKPKISAGETAATGARKRRPSTARVARPRVNKARKQTELVAAPRPAPAETPTSSGSAPAAKPAGSAKVRPDWGY